MLRGDYLGFAAGGVAAAAAGCCAWWRWRGAAERRLGRASRGTVGEIRRFAVKGLSGDLLTSAELEADGGLPDDRRWALMKGGDEGAEFDPQNPQWVHKKHFYCAYSCAKEVWRLSTRYSDSTTELNIHVRESGEAGKFRLNDAAGRRQAEIFLGRHFGDDRLRIVSADVPHQFGNTPAGLKRWKYGRLLHIINTQTVADFSARAKCKVGYRRFRANVVLTLEQPWVEFEWVGRRVRIGSCVIEVVCRSVRCPAVNFNPDTGEEDCEVTTELPRLFPQHGPYLGVYARVVGAGTFRSGDPVCLLDAFGNPVG
eukprot:TRINITY_DN24029_c0_g2_i1.p1 TRINITY_DN24029_c0_g2~~TRINITY_DN24029_c0_g2_i1.p1  ORF type:complete len:312 (+),score=67.50 TRINITY_DN24029_c0_g2_i1:76-1011(+)